MPLNVRTLMKRATLLRLPIALEQIQTAFSQRQLTGKLFCFPQGYRPRSHHYYYYYLRRKYNRAPLSELRVKYITNLTMLTDAKKAGEDSGVENSSSDGESSELPDKRAQRLIWVDLEMTGLDFVSDRILEIACLITEGDLTLVAEGPHLIIHESDEVLNRMGEWCTQHHGESGLTEAVRNSKISLEEAEKMVLDFIKEYTPKGTCPLAGNTIGMDKSFIHQHMPRFSEHLHHRVVDVSSIKELCRRWYPDEFKAAPIKKDKHRAMDDILESIEELKYYRSSVFK